MAIINNWGDYSINEKLRMLAGLIEELQNDTLGLQQDKVDTETFNSLVSRVEALENPE